MKFTRGDTHCFRFQRKRNKQPIVDQAENIYFTVKEYNSDDAPVLIQKTIEDIEFDSNYYYHVSILPKDTNELEYKTYYYDIEVKIGEDYVKTIKKGQLILTDESTTAKDEV